MRTWRARHRQRRSKKGKGRAQERNFRVRDWSNWDLRRRREATWGVNWEDTEWRRLGWCLRSVMALSANKTSDGGGREANGNGTLTLPILYFSLLVWCIGELE